MGPQKQHWHFDCHYQLCQNLQLFLIGQTLEGGDSVTRSANPSTEVLLKNGSVFAIVSKFNIFVYVLNLKN